MSKRIAWLGAGVALAFGLAAPASAAADCPCSLFTPSTTPQVANWDDPNAVELGVAFKSDVSGFIDGVRFYKGTANTGTHVGSVWLPNADGTSGTLLGRATFSNETASGWQQVNFSTPVAITAGTLYVASYHTDVGNYAVTPQFFSSSGFDNAPLHAPGGNASDPNGLFAYSAVPTFPTGTYNGNNYFVDVVFTPTPLPASIAVNAPTSTLEVGASEQLQAVATFGDGSTSDITSQVTWTESDPAATVSPAGELSALSAGSTTVTASDYGVSGSLPITITPASTTTSLSSDHQQGSTYGDTVTFTAAVQPIDTALTVAGGAGTVEFTEKVNGSWRDVPGCSAVPLGGLTGNIATCATSGLAAGSDEVMASYGGTANYASSSSPTFTQNVTAKALTVSGITAADKVYDGNTSATLNTGGAGLVGVVSGDAVSLSTSGAGGQFADKNVGTGKTVSVSGLTISGTDAGNYILTQPTTTANITAKPLTITGAAANNKVYDGTTAATVDFGGASLVGAASGDSVSIDHSKYSANFADKNVGAGKPVTVTGVALSGTDAGNYILTQPTTTANIATKPLTVSGITAANKVYDGNTTATLNTGSAALVGVASGDTVSLSTSGAGGRFADKNVGAGKTVSVSGLTISGTDAGNYTLTQPTTTASITARTLTVSATGVNKTYDSTTNASVVLSTSALSGDNVTVGDASASFQDPSVGTNKTVTVTGISISGGTDQGNYILGNTTATTTANIMPANTTTSISLTPSSPQYSDVLTLAATVAGPGTPTGSVQFQINGNNVGSAQTLASGKASLNYKVTQAPGTYTATVMYTSDSANWTGSTSTANSLTVSQEDASATYSGGTLFWGTSTTASTATATLAATITDASDGSPGDIRNARVSFIDYTNPTTPKTLCSNLSVGLVSTSDTTVGTATCNASLAIGTQNGTSYNIGIQVSGYYTNTSGYYTNTPSTTLTTVEVADPLSSGFITGGGFLINSNSSGTYSGDSGQKTNFGFNVKYNSSATNLQGQINTIVRHSEPNAPQHVYQIKGNSMTSLTTKACATSTNPSTTCPSTATFNGKANIQDITNPAAPISIDGNATLQVAMTDGGSPGTNDTIGITVWNKSGGIWFSSYWNGTQTQQQALGGGDVSVH
jgi:hypothetical protein